jgi:cytidyltransferase-like protein
MNSAANPRLPLVAFTGRFQPFHRDHLAMVRHALTIGTHVLIGITNPDGAPRAAHPANAHRHLDEANPYSYVQRVELVAAALQADAIDAARYHIVPFPLDTPAEWPAILPPGTPQLVRVFTEWEREKVRRFAAAGYPPIVIEGDLETRLTATDVRRCLAAGEGAPDSVPPGARELLMAWAKAAPVAASGGAAHAR